MYLQYSKMHSTCLWLILFKRLKSWRFYQILWLKYTAFDGYEINFRRDAPHGARQCCVYRVILSFKGFNPCFCTCTVLRLLNIMFLRLFFRLSNEHPDRRENYYTSFLLILPIASLKFNWDYNFLVYSFLYFIVYARQFILKRNPRVLYKLS